MRSEPTWMWGLLVTFIATLFIPDDIAVNLGSIKLTPALVVSIVLFPILITWARIRWAWPDILVAAFFLASFLSLISNSPITVTMESFGRSVLFGGVPYLVGRYVGLNPDLLNRFIRIILWTLVILAVPLIFEAWFQRNIHSIVWGVPYRPHPEQRLGLTRAHGWTSHAIMLGLTYAAFIPIALVGCLEKLRFVGRWRWLKLALLAVGVFCSLSTGAWLCAAIAIGLVAWDYWSMLSPAKRWLLVGLGSPILYLMLEVASGRPLLRILMMHLHLSSPLAWHYRWQLYERVFAVMPGKWLLGWGGVVPESFVGYMSSIDNNYLAVLLFGGLLGLVLWIGMILGVLIYGWNSVWRARDVPGRRLARAVMFAIVAIALTQLSVALFSTAAMVNWMCMGAAVGLSQVLRRRPSRRARARVPRRRTRQESHPGISMAR